MLISVISGQKGFMSIIKVENLSKKYIIGHDKAAAGAYRYYSLRESLMHHARGMYQRLRHPLTPNRENTELEEFWALKDINFEIKQGERVGIIGRNGAGKSTLLKILSRITEPTSGKITMKGRVASLLEVGTGFHPELTGRENIYLNGAILGMTRIEIKKKFDEIVAFAEIDKFLDTPVKRYSSGMYVRLAFAVAAHLEPEILLVDEVLAVGDAQFQKKCLGKMEDVSKEGRTVIFVSHNMGAIAQLCKKTLLLDNGNIIFNGDVNTGIKEYLNKNVNLDKLFGRKQSFDLEKKECYISRIWSEQEGAITTTIKNGIKVEFYLNVVANIELSVSFELIIKDQDFHPIIFSPLGILGISDHKLYKGNNKIKMVYDLPYLAQGRYHLDFILAKAGKKNYDNCENAIFFDVVNNYGKNRWEFKQSKGQGCISIEGESYEL